MPSHERVLPFGNVFDRVATPLVRQREKRIRQDEHDCAHILMYVTEDLYGSRAVEGPGAGLALGESSEVETAGAGGAGQRVDVVKDVVVVGELDCAAAGDGRHVWNEALVALGDACAPTGGVDGKSGELVRIALEIHDDVPRFGGERVAWRRRRGGSWAGVGINAELRAASREGRRDLDRAFDTARGN